MKEFIIDNHLTTACEHIIFYKKLKDRYKFLCSECGTTWYGTYEDLKLIRATRMCPKCFEYIKVATTTEKHLEGAIYNAYTGKGYKYYCTVKNAKVSNVKVDYMFRFDGKQAYLRGYHRVWIAYYSKRFVADYGTPLRYANWVKTGKNWQEYFNFWIDSKGRLEGKLAHKKSYKQYVENLFNDELKELKPYLKSNQKYLIQHNLLNEDMIRCLIAFNMNSVELLYKYHNYINYYYYDIPMSNVNLNEHAFEYVAKNQLYIKNYFDYRETCETLGIVDKYPKNFSKRDAEVQSIMTNMPDTEKCEMYDKKIKLINLPKTRFTAKNKDYYINPYKTALELKNDAKTFSNCIYNNYTESYANRETDLYRCIDNTGKLIACIEICDGEIEQIMGNKNSKPRLYKQIRSALVEMVGTA